MSTNDDQQHTGPGVAATSPPSTLESVRRLWLGFAANVPADTQDISLVMEATGRALEAIRLEYEVQEREQYLASCATQRGGESLLYLSGSYNDVITSLLQSAQLWGEDVVHGIAGCDKRAAAGIDTTIRSLLHLCKAQRMRLTQRALHYERLQLEIYRQILRAEGSTELLIL